MVGHKPDPKEAHMVFLTGITFVTGLILAQQVGAWFPWVNFAGMAVLFVSVLLANRLTARGHA